MVDIRTREDTTVFHALRPARGHGGRVAWRSAGRAPCLRRPAGRRQLAGEQGCRPVAPTTQECQRRPNPQNTHCGSKRSKARKLFLVRMK